MASKSKAAAPAPKKSAKKPAKALEVETAGEAAPAIDQDELDEAADAAASSSSSGGSSNDAALAAANGSGEMSASFKNFRHHPDMENFYRFIYENDLRHEALSIIDKMMAEKVSRRAQGKGAKNAH